MPALQYIHLDVFTNQLFTGNQLAVFLAAAGIDERRMQRIANEMAFGETTFVSPPEAPGTDARVRIFTPSRELPMVHVRECRQALLVGCVGQACEIARAYLFLMEEGIARARPS
jgi:hypothetical protein